MAANETEVMSASKKGMGVTIFSIKEISYERRRPVV
jgi:hypothetical protein